MANTSFRWDCPHCSSSKAAFEIVYQRRARGDALKFYADAVCGVCDNGLIVHYKQLQNSSMIGLTGHAYDFPGSSFSVIQIWPKRDWDVPENLPENVSNFYQQGILNQKMGNWDASGAMFRKALDVATKAIDPAISNKTLFNRIELLVNKGNLTKEIGSWAHEVRIDGNRSVHDDDPETKDDVEAIHQFCRAVLLYTFTFPALVQQRSSARAMTTANTDVAP